MGNTVAIMFTLTTYGTWLRGNHRGWVQKGTICPPDPKLMENDRKRLKFHPYYFNSEKLFHVGELVGKCITEFIGVKLYALTIEKNHMHFVIGTLPISIPDFVKKVKDFVRKELKEKRPIWTDKYDKRFCFSTLEAKNRIAYVQKHNLENGLPANPWDFIHPF